MIDARIDREETLCVFLSRPNELRFDYVRRTGRLGEPFARFYHFTFPIRIGTNFGEPSRDQRSCISSLDPATVKKLSHREKLK